MYPKRPGKIDADDVQIVVNYPTAIGKSRSPFGSMFEHSAFGGRSPFSGMMDEGFFGSAFGDRLAVVSSRPIVGQAAVDSTEVMAVPNAGRPADYRGAVGRYRIVCQATPTTVDAGDPITLNIGIVGTGPMELVQAPPLHEQSTLTADFKVADEALAGFVQDDSKVFSTTIRPRREGITEIPPIQFSFFDPETESFATVVSEPIAITVNKSETLALDAIVGNAKSRNGSPVPRTTVASGPIPDFTNVTSVNALTSHPVSTRVHWWWILVISPPFFWLATVVAHYRKYLLGRLPSVRSARSHAEAAVNGTDDGQSIEAALAQFIARRSGSASMSTVQAVGALRVAGMVAIANEVESFLNRLKQQKIAVTSFGRIVEIIAAANEKLLSFVGFRTIVCSLVGASLLFWGLLTARAWGHKIASWRLLAVSACLLLFSLCSTIVAESASDSAWNAVIVANNVSLHAGDGEQFDEVFSIDAAQGHPIEVLTRRGTWTQIRTAEGHIGWVPLQSIELITTS